MKRSLINTVQVLLCLMYFGCSPWGYASQQTVQWFGQPAGEQTVINVDLFVSSTCPYCHKADLFFRELEEKHSWVVVHRHVINQDRAALGLFYERLQQQGSSNFAVPAFFFCNSHWAGFDKAETTGHTVFQALTFCQKKISQQGELSPTTASLLQKWGQASQFQMNPALEPSVAKVLTLTALADAFSPCSIFSFAALLAFLWLFSAQKWGQLAIGLWFVLVLGLSHYLQQSATAWYYQNISQFHFAIYFVAMLLLLYVVKTYRTLGLQDADKPGILAFFVVFVTVAAVQAYQQSCFINLGLVFEMWLRERSFSASARFGDLILYQIFYVLPLFVVLLLFFILGRHSRLLPYQDWLKRAACWILFSISLIALIHPQWFSSLSVSIGVLFGSLILGRIVRQR